MIRRLPTGMVKILAVLSERPHNLHGSLIAAGPGLHIGRTIDDLLEDQVKLLVGLLGQLAVPHHVIDLRLDSRRQSRVLRGRKRIAVNGCQRLPHRESDVVHAAAQDIIGRPLLAVVEPRPARRGWSFMRVWSGGESRLP